MVTQPKTEPTGTAARPGLASKSRGSLNSSCNSKMVAIPQAPSSGGRSSNGHNNTRMTTNGGRTTPTQLGWLLPSSLAARNGSSATATTTTTTPTSSKQHHRSSTSTLYWDHYYHKFDHRHKSQRRRRRTWLLFFFGALVLLYFAISSSLAYWSLQNYQHEKKQQVVPPPSSTASKAFKTTTARPPPPPPPPPKRTEPKPQQSEPEQQQPPPPSKQQHQQHEWVLDATAARAFFAKHPQQQESLPVLKAYLEPPLRDVKQWGSRGDMKVPKDHGTAPELVQPLPLRTHTPWELRKVEYPQRIRSCADMPGRFPTDRGLQWEANGELQVTNVGDRALPDSYAQDELPYCPVDADPFLPWIHDVFPSLDGAVIHVIGQNKRRCHTGSKHDDVVNHLTPQVALMQPISVQQISEQTAQQLAPQLWKPNTTNGTTTTTVAPRYRLAPRDEIRTGHNYTRFICRFAAWDAATGRLTTLGETLSEYEFNYEYASYRKQETSLLTPKGKDTKLFWTSNVRFTCPVPNNTDSGFNLPQRLAHGDLVFFDKSVAASEALKGGMPLLYLDVIPIRTSVRYKEHYLGEELIGPRSQQKVKAMDPKAAWGEHGHVVPHVEASGRWTNIPLCLPPQLTTKQQPEPQLKPDLLALNEYQDVHTRNTSVSFVPTTTTHQNASAIVPRTKKPHFLSACLWASAEFKTRGLRKGATSDTAARLVEWIEFHVLVGFDHFYIYDNSGAHTNATSLRPVLEPYIQEGVVTYYEWPAAICNNNVPAADSTGERSSQYAAENSCRTRHAPFSEWLISFDTDEYLVPMGGRHHHQSLQTVLQQAHDETGLNIMSFKSSRGKLRESLSSLQVDKDWKPTKEGEVDGSKTRVKFDNVTYLQAYNCDGAGSPKPAWAERARKQVYLADYVLYHFVHYSTVTVGYLDTYEDALRRGERYHYQFREHGPSERPSNELTEAVMVHTKTVKEDQTRYYDSHCHYNWTKKWQGCLVGIPFPDEKVNKKSSSSSLYRPSDGLEYNCHINQHLETVWIPQLQQALQKRWQSHPELQR